MYDQGSIQIEIKDLGTHGEGIGVYENLVVFVDGALPHELVEIDIVHKKKNYAKGKLLKIIRPSKSRVNPICPVFGVCGGCQIMHESYEMQLQLKTQRVKSSLQRIGKLPTHCVEECRPSPHSLHYRNKIQLPVTAKENGGCKIGLYKRESHDIVEVNHCYIHTPLGEKVFQTLKALIDKHQIKPYDHIAHTGDLRHLLIRTAVFEEKVLVVLICAQGITPAIEKLAQELVESVEEVKGVIHHLNTRSDNVVIDRNFQLLAGESFIIEKLSNLSFKVSAASFFQVNPHQAIHLYNQALELAQLQAHERVLDAYCGVGTLSLFIGQVCKDVLGVESVAQAIIDAKENACLNHMEHVQFKCSKVEDCIEDVGHIDVAFINPPRKGCEESVLRALGELKPRCIIYISCDPATLSRDASILASLGYSLDKAIPFDMFPQTMHVETVARFSKNI